jgi:hypothetical protein
VLLTKRAWLALAIPGSIAAAVAPFATFHQTPRWENPVRMAHEVIFSSRDFTTLTGQLVPQFTQVNGRLAVMTRLSTHFERLTSQVEQLPSLASQIDGGAAALATNLAPAPSGVTAVSGQVVQGTTEVRAVGATVDSVTSQLNQVEASLGTVSTQLAGLQPIAAEIAATMAQIDADTRVFGQLPPGSLTTLSQLLNSLTGRGA